MLFFGKVTINDGIELVVSCVEFLVFLGEGWFGIDFFFFGSLFEF